MREDITTGGCLCGAIRFTIAGPFEHFFLCHCSRCRKATGSAHAATLFSNTARLDWLSGRELVRTFQLPGTRYQKSFCSHCGSPVPNLRRNGGQIVVPAGSLETVPILRPEAHICFSDRAGWEEAAETAPRIDGLPGGRP
ncbi:GFA family protein [Pseudodonghicola flavimaris]|uniref:GFA family protein n=1 Tax=Pseudodonghicola flavimaris TaxID=3050036 RepID=A0ABT7EZZ5_9RHOB|nr:GFA family protein [Pseudodonghicola flavimaris]MDK3017825.1 GFA family protein [Pseudodonghicola flavimaris]